MLESLSCFKSELRDSLSRPRDMTLEKIYEINSRLLFSAPKCIVRMDAAGECSRQHAANGLRLKSNLAFRGSCFVAVMHLKITLTFSVAL